MRQPSGSWQRAARDTLHFDNRQLLRLPWPRACRRGGCTPRSHATTSPLWTISPWSAGHRRRQRILRSSFHCVALNTFTWHAWARAHTHTPRTTRSTSGSGQGALQSWPDMDRGTDRGARPSRFHQKFLQDVKERVKGVTCSEQNKSAFDEACIPQNPALGVPRA